MIERFEFRGVDLYTVFELRNDRTLLRWKTTIEGEEYSVHDYPVQRVLAVPETQGLLHLEITYRNYVNIVKWNVVRMLPQLLEL